METCCSAPDLPSEEDDSDDEEVPNRDPCRSMRDSISGPNLPLTQKRKCPPYYGVHRDKESLLEEALELQEAFQDQKFHFQVHKEFHHAVHRESRRLESQIDFLETSGLEAPRTGTLTKLRSKVKGCRFRRMELETTCATNAEIVRKLRLDSQFMKSQVVEFKIQIFILQQERGLKFVFDLFLNRIDVVCQRAGNVRTEAINYPDAKFILEAKVQRDAFALEVRRLQRFLFHLNNLYRKVCHETKEVVRLKEQIVKLAAKFQELEPSVSAKSKSLENMAVETLEWTVKGDAASAARATDNSRFKSLQEESKYMMDMLLTEKLAKASFTTMVNTLAHEVRLAEKETREKSLEAASAPGTP